MELRNLYYDFTLALIWNTKALMILASSLAEPAIITYCVRVVSYYSMHSCHNKRLEIAPVSAGIYAKLDHWAVCQPWLMNYRQG